MSKVIGGEDPSPHEPFRAGQDKNDLPRKRSKGWSPLVYPSTAVVLTSPPSPAVQEHGALNPYFPLNRDVILAAVRELLILDGTIDKKTLGVSQGMGSSRNMHRHMSGVDASNIIDARKNSSMINARATTVSSMRPRTVSLDDITNTAEPKMKISSSTFSAESVADAILMRSMEGSLISSTSEGSMNGIRPRKADPACIDSATTLPFSVHAGQVVLESNGYNARIDESGNINVREAIAGIPQLLNISISPEARLRHKARDITSNILYTFSDRPLRDFMGYKSAALKREHVLEVMSDYLFDVSHAAFAWEQTENEIILERGDDKFASNELVLKEELDFKICNDLFDSRALKKIGEFNSSSLLPHAIYIRRSRMKGLSWKAFAMTGQGKKMLRHHRVGSSAISDAGQKRRYASRKRSSFGSIPDDERGGKRSRSSSFASISEESSDDGAESSAVGLRDINASPVLSLCAPDVVPLTLTRKKGNSWGVALAKEGGLCIVEKVSNGNAFEGSERLKVGDIIYSIRNNEGRSGQISKALWAERGLAAQEKISEQGFYREVVDMFKASQTLFLEVRRVI